LLTLAVSFLYRFAPRRKTHPISEARAVLERRTRIWLGLSTVLLAGTAVERVPLARESSDAEAVPQRSRSREADISAQPRIYIAQAHAAGEGGPGEGGGQVLGTITEFRLASTDPNAFAYDAAAQISAYGTLVHEAYAAAHAAAGALKDAIAALVASPSAETLEAARAAWSAAREAYLRTEAFQFYSGPVDGPGGPAPRLNAWPIDPAVIDGLIADPAQSLNFRALARLNRIEAPVKVTTGLHVIEYLLWSADGAEGADAFPGETGARRGDYLTAIAQLLVNDLSVLTAAWAPGTGNNYRGAVEAMDQRNALGRAFNGMAVLIGYEVPLRRIGAGLFPANENFQPSPFSHSSADDMRASFEGARQVYFEAGLDKLVASKTDAELAAKISGGFERAAMALAAMDAPYERFLAPAKGSPERATAEAAVRALTDLARDLRQAGNRLGILVVVPGM
jgi:putative iron-regulated protein